MSVGYEFVPFPPDVQRQLRLQTRWGQSYDGTFAGILHVTFFAEQHVHIGSGHKRLHDRKVLRAAVRIQGGPGIPGSSLKGVLRSRYEAITRSCIQQLPPTRAKVRSQSHRDIEIAKLTKAALDQAVLHGRCDQRASCPACALFGLMSLRSRITVRDFACPADVAFAVAPIHAQFAPNLHHVGQAIPMNGQPHKGRRTTVPALRHAGEAATPYGFHSGSSKAYFEVHNLHGRKFAVGMGPIADKPERQWIEVIPSGSIIAGTIGVFNLLPAELGGVLAALGRMPTSIPAVALKIGGGKGRGFGRLRLVDVAYALRDHAGQKVVVDQSREQGWRKAFEDSADRWDIGERRLHEIHRGDC